MSIRSSLTEHLPSPAYAIARLLLRPLPSRRSHYARKRRIEHALGLDVVRVVRSGPFSGMRYIDDSIGSSLIPKLLGSYEAELHAAVDGLINAGGIRTVVNVGCAEGYYAVGFALRCPDATVVAYDSSPRARRLCRRLAIRNGVDERVQIHGRIDSVQLRRVVGPEVILFCDCDGCERALIDPEAVPELRDTALVVELHDYIYPSISSTVVNRFAASHSIELIDAADRAPSAFADILEPLTPQDRAYALDEARPMQMRWAVMTPR